MQQFHNGGLSWIQIAAYCPRLAAVSHTPEVLPMSTHPEAFEHPRYSWPPTDATEVHNIVVSVSEHRKIILTCHTTVLNLSLLLDLSAFSLHGVFSAPRFSLIWLNRQ
jgi:hypothetical protein